MTQVSVSGYASTVAWLERSGADGVQDGQQFLYSTSTEKTRLAKYWDTISAVRRYGALSPWRTNRAVNALLKKFADLYNPIFLAKRGVVDSIDAFGETVGLGKDLTTRYGTDWAKMVGLGDKWINEIIGSSTRVNVSLPSVCSSRYAEHKLSSGQYGRNVNEIHALGAGVSMATGGASAVEGGNWQIFKGMLDESKAIVQLNTLVWAIETWHRLKPELMVRYPTSSPPVPESNRGSSWRPTPLLSPTVSSMRSSLLRRGIDRPCPSPSLQNLPTQYRESACVCHCRPVKLTSTGSKQPYVHLHVTYLTTSRQSPDHRFFDLPERTKVPNTILTSSSALAAEFNSITWHGETRAGSGEYAVKIFSMQRLSEDFLYRLLGGEVPSWVLRKEWDSYPALGPISAFAPVEPIKGFHYLGAMEPWIST